jgi:hypothetical protein
LTSAGNLAAAEAGFLAAGIPAVLVTELLEAYSEAKRRFHLGDLRPNLVEGGRFSEAVFRILQWATDGGIFTPLGGNLPGVTTLLGQLAQRTGNDDSLRLHIPRVLQGIYEIRNNRNGPHLGAIDVNKMDATLVVHDMDWVLAELVRLYHNIGPNEAQALVDDLVAKEIPAMQIFDGFPRILKDLTQADHLLVLLYWRGSAGANRPELRGWLPTASAKSNLSANIKKLSDSHLAHESPTLVRITINGEKDVEARKLIEPA